MLRLLPLAAVPLLALLWGDESVLTLSAKRKHPGCVALPRHAARPAPAPRPRVDTKDGHGGVAMEDWAKKKAQLAAWVVGPAPQRNPLAHRSPFELFGPIGDGLDGHQGVDPNDFLLGADDVLGQIDRAEVPDSDRLKQAKDVYLRGYQMKETDPEAAVTMFKDVIGMTPPGSEYHEKALARLKELAR